MNKWPSTAVIIAVISIGYTALALGTDNWSVWTAEAARRQAVLMNPHPLPDFVLVDSLGTSFSLSESERPLRVIDFVYTSCPTVCVSMGTQLRQLQAKLSSAGLLEHVEIVSITFDPAHDDEQALALYLERFGAVQPQWRAARFETEENLGSALAMMGVVVIPEPRLGFVHNAAFYLVENGAVLEIFDVGSIQPLLQRIQDRLGS